MAAAGGGGFDARNQDVEPTVVGGLSTGVSLGVVGCLPALFLAICLQGPELIEGRRERREMNGRRQNHEASVSRPWDQRRMQCIKRHGGNPGGSCQLAISTGTTRNWE